MDLNMKIAQLLERRLRAVQAYHLEEFGNPDGLVLREHDVVPEPGRHEALVRVRATSLNYRDLLILQDRYAFPVTPGIVPLSDGAGEVVAVGEGVRRVAVGDRVAGIYFLRWFDGRLTQELAREQFGATQDGMLSEFRSVSEESLVKVPDHLSFEEAATLPCAAVTAWSALTGGRPVVAGESVLTLGTGGVALFALQFAKLFGARVISATSSDRKAGLLKKLGADDVIDYTATLNWDEAVLELTDGRGVDRVVESVGPGTLERSIRSAGVGAEIALMGIFGGAGEIFDPRVLNGRLLTIRRVAVGSRAAFEAMNRAVSLHGLRPVVDRIFPFSEAGEAYRHLEARKHVGKVVVSGA